MCQFSHLEIGQEVSFTAKACNYCGATINIETIATYGGHITQERVYDVFNVAPSRCPACKGLLIKSYFECDTGPEIDCEVFTKTLEYSERRGD